MLTSISLRFDASTQSLDALRSAAYRILDIANCEISKDNEYWICLLSAKIEVAETTLKSRFLDLVTDENIRESLATKTEPVRNLILSLAFGALAYEKSKT